MSPHIPGPLQIAVSLQSGGSNILVPSHTQILRCVGVSQNHSMVPFPHSQGFMKKTASELYCQCQIQKAHALSSSTRGQHGSTQHPGESPEADGQAALFHWSPWASCTYRQGPFDSLECQPEAAKQRQQREHRCLLSSLGQLLRPWNTESRN